MVKLRAEFKLELVEKLVIVELVVIRRVMKYFGSQPVAIGTIRIVSWLLVLLLEGTQIWIQLIDFSNQFHLY